MEQPYRCTKAHPCKPSIEMIDGIEFYKSQAMQF